LATVYFFKVGDKELFKIGKTTTDPEKRLKAVSTGSAYPLEIFKLIEHELHSKLEVFLHKFFKNDRAKNGEFFSIPLSEFDNKVKTALEEFEKLQNELNQIEELKNIQNNDTILQSNQEVNKIYNDLIKIKLSIKDLKEEQEKLENKLKLIIGKNEGIKDIATWKTQSRETFNKEQYIEEHPEEYLKYIEVKSSRNLRLK
jgi:FtsZ-binding cell division protein ZapB